MIDDRRRIELEDLYDPEPDDELVAVARDERREAGARGDQRASPRCPRCGRRHDYPVCPDCGRPMREPRSEVEVRWLRNNGFEVPSDDGARVPDGER